MSWKKIKEWYFNDVSIIYKSKDIKNYHLFYTVIFFLQYIIIVKVQRVFPSSCR